MAGLGEHIEYLLFDHDCVIVPNFGGFVANPHSAKINRLKGRIDPPFKEIGFNQRLTKNDGLLADRIRQAEEITYEESLQRIEANVEEILTLLKTGKTYHLDRIGSFYLDSNSSLRFSPKASVNFNLDFFGFEPVQAAILSEPKEELSEESITEDKQEATPIIPIQRASRAGQINWKTTAMIAACVPLLLYLLWIPTRVDMSNDQVRFQFSDLNPYVEPPCPLYEKRNEFPDLIHEPAPEKRIFNDLALSNENYITTSIMEEADPNYNQTELVTIELRDFPAEAVSTRVKHAFVPKESAFKFYVVGGCFREYDNANRMIYNLRKKGFKAVLIDQKNGLFRVGIEGSNSREKIVHQLDRAKASGYADAWVLRK